VVQGDREWQKITQLTVIAAKKSARCEMGSVSILEGRRKFSAKRPSAAKQRRLVYQVAIAPNNLHSTHALNIRSSSLEL